MKCQKKTINLLEIISSLSSSIPFPVNERSICFHPVDDSDPSLYRPSETQIDILLNQAICSGWLTRHKRPFRFMKSTKKRFVILVDRMLYSFKSETTNSCRGSFEITKDTDAYLKDRPGYCIEIRKGVSDIWLLEVPDVESLKIWLRSIKRVIAWLRANNQGMITRCRLEKEGMTEEEGYARLSMVKKTRPKESCLSLAFDTLHRPIISLPPQLPPPKTSPPPIPSS